MSDLPIIFGDHSVQAILRGLKSQTRRIQQDGGRSRWSTGDTLWVKEAWSVDCAWDLHPPREIPETAKVTYAADTNRLDRPPDRAGRLRSPLFMPRWVSRIDLSVEDVRRERLHSIGTLGAMAEGIEEVWYAGTAVQRIGNAPWEALGGPVSAYRALWDRLNGKRAPWKSNPWVWVIRFQARRMT